jgi:hypothetical protein
MVQGLFQKIKQELPLEIILNSQIVLRLPN